VAGWLLTGFEGLDDDHGSAACGAGLLEGIGLVIALWVGVGFVVGRRDVEQLSGSGQVLGPAAVGGEAIMADAVKARGEHVEEKASDELGKRRMNSGIGRAMVLCRSPSLAR
jgi:hypothetical protein